MFLHPDWSCATLKVEMGDTAGYVAGMIGNWRFNYIELLAQRQCYHSFEANLLHRIISYLGIGEQYI